MCVPKNATVKDTQAVCRMLVLVCMCFVPGRLIEINKTILSGTAGGSPVVITQVPGGVSPVIHQSQTRQNKTLPTMLAIWHNAAEARCLSFRANRKRKTHTVLLLEFNLAKSVSDSRKWIKC